jgi:hypothetical protein
MEIRQEVSDNPIEIYQNMNVENIAPYRPANNVDWNVFEYNWCGKCKRVWEPCQIASDAMSGKQPVQLICLDNKPNCTAFELIIDSGMT